MIRQSKILIVDDDKDDQSFLSDVIAELYPSIKCKVASNGQEALEYIAADPPPPDLIFLDLNMPVLNGFEFLRDYRTIYDLKKSKVIIYSTSSNPRDKEITKNLGAAEYITKMADYDKLKTKLKQVVHEYIQ
jgi:CheY-like chemotaxis protein